MLKYTRRFAAPVTLALLLAVTACAEKGDANDALATDTTLNRDLELANRDTTAQPSLTDVPATVEPEPQPVAPTRTATAPRPRTTAPAPRPAAPRTTAPRTTPRTTPATTSGGNTASAGSGTSERRLGTIAAGSTLRLSSGSRICTNSARVGDRFTATVGSSVTGSNGAVIPAGATANVEVTSLRRSENANDPITVGVAIRSVTFGGRTYAVSGTTSSATVERVRSTTRGKDVQKVATGAAIGAIAGQILGRDTRGTVTGAAAGAAVGAAAAAATANYDGCIPTGGQITVTLDNSVQVHT